MLPSEFQGKINTHTATLYYYFDCILIILCDYYEKLFLLKFSGHPLTFFHSRLINKSEKNSVKIQMDVDTYVYIYIIFRLSILEDFIRRRTSSPIIEVVNCWRL
jgi:hypothetical protein